MRKECGNFDYWFFNVQEDAVSINWQTDGDATPTPSGTDSGTGNCTIVPREAAVVATNLIRSFGTALNITEKSPENLLSGEERDRLAIIRHNQQRGYLPDLKQIDFILELLRRCGV